LPGRKACPIPPQTRRAGRTGIILRPGKNTEQIELLELDAAGIHVAEYLTVLPPPEVLQAKLHDAIEVARTRIQSREEENLLELPARDRS
jgi:hypothetical protein